MLQAQAEPDVVVPDVLLPRHAVDDRSVVDPQLDDVAAVVWATGFRPDYSWLDVPGVWDGHQIVHQRGAIAAPGLWFIGLPWQHSRGSALLGFVGDDAAWVAGQIASHVPTRPTPGARA